MKIVIVSDTHGENALLKKVALEEYDASLFLHLGDALDYSEAIAPFVAVKGNCDSTLFHYPPSRELLLPSGKKAFFRHYPYSGTDVEELRKEGFSFLFHGHTHKREESVLKVATILCPGSLSFPRDGQYGSYLVLECDESKEKWIFKNI